MSFVQIDGIEGASIAKLPRHIDSRGFFSEIFRQSELGTEFVQANHSHSNAGVLRGLHWHKRQTDAWYVIGGRAQAMLADVRNKTEKPVVRSIELSADEPSVLVIPPGVAHGFLAITDVDLIYWVTTYYDASDEFGVAYNDRTLNAPWQISDPVLSDRDAQNPELDWDSISISS